MEHKTSVIIPVLNEEENIEYCLGSLLNQIEKPLEVIVVDNGSKDKSLKIVNSLKNKFKKKGISLRVFYYPIGNQTNAREFGIKKSSGNIIGSLDAEAYANNDWILKIKEYFKDKEIVGIGGKSTFRNKGSVFNFSYTLNYYLRLIFNLYCIGGGNSAFRKSSFLSVNGYKGLKELRKKENIVYAKDDYFLSKKLEKKGELKFCCDLNVTLLYRIRDKRSKHYKSYFDIKNVIKRAVMEGVYDYKITKAFKDSPNEFGS